MRPEEFEKCKAITEYDDFMTAALDFDQLTMDEYKDFMPILFNIVPEMQEEDPVEMYEAVIEELRKGWTTSQELPFHGPWHHGLVAGILICALKNNGYDFTRADVVEALKRGLMIPGGGCGFHGVCGAATGLGITISMITGSNPFHDNARSQALKGAAEAIDRVARLGGPRCCALSTYTTLNIATRRLKDLGYELPRAKLAGRCAGHALNSQCHGQRCPYYPRG